MTQHRRPHPSGRRRWLGAVLIGTLLSACAYAVVERNAPELGKRYILTSNLVLTDSKMAVPRLVPGQPLVPYALTRADLDSFKSMYGSLLPEGQLTDRGMIARGSGVEVLVVFISRYPEGEYRAAEFRFTDAVTGEEITAYAPLDDLLPMLQEVE